MLSFLILSFSWVGVIVFLGWQFRIWKTGSKQIWRINLLFCIFWIGYIFLWNQIQQKQAIVDQTNINGHLVMHADEYEVDGDLLKIQAKWLEGHQKVQAYYRIKEKNEKKRWLASSKTVTYTFSGKIRQVSLPTNENEFNFRRFEASRNIVNAINIEELQVSSSKIKSSLLDRLLAYLHYLRKKMLLYLQKLPQPLSLLAEVLLLGYQKQDFNNTLEKIRLLGLSYLFSLSGMHVFYLISAFKWIFQRMRITRETTENIILIILPIYGILGGCSLSLMRSIGMAFITLISRKFFLIKITTIESWSFVLLVNLFYAPASIFDFGAQLSYLLTLILLLNKNSSAVLLGIRLTFFSIPLVLWNTYQWNLLTIFLTVVIVPFFEWLIMPCVILGSLIPLVSEACNTILVQSVNILTAIANFPTNIIYGKPPLFWIVFWMFLSILLMLGKHKRILVALCISSYFFVFMWIHYPLYGEIVYIDIGQGDSTLIRTPYNKSITLIDTGGKVSFQTEKWQTRHSKTNGETIVANYLLSKGISSLDRLILTHQDADHVGNFPSISKLISIKRVYVPAGMEKLSSFQHRLVKSSIKQNHVYPVKIGDLIDDPNINILHPTKEGQGTNADSVVLEYNFYGVPCLFTGDLDKDNEIALIKRLPNLQVDILKLGHHGSKTSSDESFIHALRPKYAIISAGRQNRYGHPNEETLETLRKNHIPYMLTAEKGMIKLVYKYNKIKISNFADENRITSFNFE